ncbi:MAG: hypothetical protein RMK18_10430 [Armatimonadota bacterium]|nr:hypothetical protein [Armatimonadota bacterium]MCX7778392.1 hypothetical protein [Armatimonadota bacterium]MDW8026261.1 hypothetical protein [Armatimonadota bacterium]
MISERQGFKWQLCVSWMCILLVSAAPKMLYAEVLRLKYQPGETLKYAIKASGITQMQTGGLTPEIKMPMQMDFTATQRVLKVDEAGNYVVRMNVVGQMQVTTPQGTTETVRLPESEVETVVTPTGKTLSYKVLKPEKLPIATPGGKLPIDVSAFASAAVGFPEGEVNVGDTWEYKTDVKVSEEKSITLSGTGKFIGYEEKGKFKCAVIELEQSSPSMTALMLSQMGLEGSSGMAKLKIKIWFSVELGRIIYQEGRYDDVMTMPLELPGGEIKLTSATAVNFVIGLVEQR